MSTLSYSVVDGEDARNPEELLALCDAIFPDFDPAYLTSRMSAISDPTLHAVRSATGQLIAFKLGYRRGQRLFYSWLGGVHPDARRLGVARELMSRQHAWALAKGYGFIETRTRASNAAMLILNLRCGFHVVGFETDASGIGVVTQRKVLTEV